MCDALVAGSEHTRDGATLFGKNSDRKHGECQPFVQFPAAHHPRDSTVRCTHVTIPEVAETYRVMGHSPWWVWGFEHGVNEHGVAIGNLAVFSREPVEAVDGLIGMDLVRLGLERGRDAREALEIIAALLEAHGQGGSALAPGAGGYHNSFVIADPEGAWLMETSGRRWAARPTTIGALSNHMSLRDDWKIGSRDLEAFARTEGWWNVGERVDVAAAYRHPSVPGVVSEGRLGRSCELLAASDGSLDVARMKAILRDHLGEGAPPEAPVSDARHFTLCAHSPDVHMTTASMVASLPTDRVAPWPVWTSFGTPCTSLFIPTYLAGVIPAAMAAGGPQFDAGSLWWVLWRLEETAASDYASHIPLLREGWKPLEEKIEAERPEVEGRARRAAVAGDDDAAALVLGDFMARVVGEVLDQAETLRARIIG